MSRMRTAAIGWGAMLLGALVGCSSTPEPAAGQDAGLRVEPVSGPVVIPQVVPYEDPGRVAGNIRSECRIDEQLSEFIASYGEELGLDVVRTTEPEPDALGTVLDVQITLAYSAGNPWVGHRKSTRIAGTLYRNGQRVARFTGLRNSGGGFWAGFKGSCSVLGRTVRALGLDVARWLQAPVNDAHLGD